MNSVDGLRNLITEFTLRFNPHMEIPLLLNQDADVGCAFSNRITSGVERLKAAYKQCNINDIRLISRGKVGEVYYGSYNNQGVAIKLSLINDEGSIYDQATASIKSTEFTNEVYIGAILTYVDIPFVTKHISYGYMDINGSRYGVITQEYCDLGTLYDVSKNKDYLSMDGSMKEYMVKDILTQVTFGLYYLYRDLGFTSGDLKTKNIFIKTQSIDSYGVKSNICVKIGDYGKSTCYLPARVMSEVSGYQYTDGKIKFYTQSTLSDTLDAVNPYILEYYNCGGTLIYKIDNSYRTIAQSRHSYKDFYKSYDFYCFFVSFLLLPEVYTLFINNRVPVLNQIFNSIFVRGDILNKIKEKQGTDSINDVLYVLNDICLKSETIDIVFQILSNF